MTNNTHDELRSWLAGARLSQNGLARLVGVNRRTVRRWCSGQNPIPDALWGRLERVTSGEITEAMRGA